MQSLTWSSHLKQEEIELFLPFGLEAIQGAHHTHPHQEVAHEIFRYFWPLYKRKGREVICGNIGERLPLGKQIKIKMTLNFSFPPSRSLKKFYEGLRRAGLIKKKKEKDIKHPFVFPIRRSWTFCQKTNLPKQNFLSFHERSWLQKKYARPIIVNFLFIVICCTRSSMYKTFEKITLYFVLSLYDKDRFIFTIYFYIICLAFVFVEPVFFTIVRKNFSIRDQIIKGHAAFWGRFLQYGRMTMNK